MELDMLLNIADAVLVPEKLKYQNHFLNFGMEVWTPTTKKEISCRSPSENPRWLSRLGRGLLLESSQSPNDLFAWPHSLKRRLDNAKFVTRAS